MNEKKYTFWSFVSHNPVTALLIVIAVVAMTAAALGMTNVLYSAITGIFAFLKTGDKEEELKRKELEAQQRTEERIASTREMEREIVAQRITNDEEVAQNVENAKAYADELDVDELVDWGNKYLAGRGNDS